MGLVPTGEIIRQAARAGRGAGAFNVIQLEHAEAIVAGAEAAAAPVILQISQNTVRYHGSLALIGSMVLVVAQSAAVPVAVHLDHVSDRDLSSVRIDRDRGGQPLRRHAVQGAVAVHILPGAV